MSGNLNIQKLIAFSLVIISLIIGLAYLGTYLNQNIVRYSYQSPVANFIYSVLESVESYYLWPLYILASSVALYISKHSLSKDSSQGKDSAIIKFLVFVSYVLWGCAYATVFGFQW